MSTSTEKVVFEPPVTDGFHRAVNAKVNAYFKDNGISKNANGEMILKTVLILSTWVGTYLAIIFNLVSPWAMFGLALLHGFATALIGLNIGHDAIHGSYSKKAGINKRLGVLFNFIGANDYVWSITHNILHHTYTNIPDHDEDIKQIPILRMQPKQDRWWIHRFQHIYALGFYCLASLSWVFLKDYRKFFQNPIGSYKRDKIPGKEVFRLFFYKAIYYGLFLVIPLILVNLPWYWILFGFFMSHFLEGFTLAIIFMLAHVIEGTDYPEPDESGKVNMPWADLQMRTTSNFAIKNPVINYLFGGLNFQVEHHLFPRVCHVHYPKIAPIVQKTAEEHGLPYLQHETFIGAIASHQRLLKRFGTVT